MPLSILIHGYYGFKNLGDELILKKIIQDIRDLSPDAQITALSGNLQETEAFHGIRAVDRFDIDGVIDAVRGCDAFILGGGGLFQDHFGMYVRDIFTNFGHGVVYYAVPALISKIFNRPVFYYTHGVGPLYTDEAARLTKWAYGLADFITVRDEYSYRLLLSLDIPKEKLCVDIDPVTKLNLEGLTEYDITHRLRLPEKRFVIGINLRPWKRREQEIVKLAGEVFRKLYEQDQNILFLLIPFDLSTDNDSDSTTLKRLAEVLPEGSFAAVGEENLTPELIISSLSRADAVVGMRFHVILTALRLAKPLIAFSYDRKIKELLLSLNAGDISFDLSSPYTEETGNRISRIMGQKERFADIAEKLNGLQYRTPFLLKEFLGVGAPKDREAEEVTDKRDIYSLISEDFLNEFAKIRDEKESLEKMLIDKDDLEQRLIASQTLLSQARSELDAIHRSKTWRLGQLYGRSLSHPRINRVLERLINAIIPDKNNGQTTTGTKSRDYTVEDEVTLSLKNLIPMVNRRKQKGVFIITSAFGFDEFYNQRVINLSKFLAENGNTVLYIAWRWTKDDYMKGICQEVYPNIFNVPVDYLFDHYPLFCDILHEKKYFVIELPHPKFLPIMLHLRDTGFTGIYDIADDWEEFHRVGQAPWFEKDHESSIVINADVVTAVSRPLIEKFSDLRADISLIPNGYSPSFLGEISGNAPSAKRDSTTIDIGYFGHLTDSWFDWDSVIESARHNKDFIFHLIGYGESEKARSRALMYDNIRLYGKVHPSELRRYAAGWDVAVLPFKISALSNAVDPIKIYEYLYFGLPTAVKGVEHLDSIPYVKNCGTQDELGDAIRDFARKKINNKISYREIEEFLKDCTWEKRFSRLLSLLGRSLI
jgi:polysaccharide pyruvyl transferase CsaB